MKPQVITVTTLRTNLPEILEKVRLLKYSFFITKYGKPFAVIGPPGDSGQSTKKRKLSRTPIDSD